MTTNTPSKRERIQQLAEELLDDIDLERLSPEAFIRKASRLARWFGSDEIYTWLKYELTYYPESDVIATKYIDLTGRWVDKEKGEFARDGIASLCAMIATRESDLKQQFGKDSTRDRNRRLREFEKCAEIRSRIISAVYDYVSDVYYESTFSGLSESIFQQYQNDVDALLAEKCGDVLDKLPSIYDRLAEGDTEAISQAMTSCRRLLKSFADAINPPSNRSIQINGNPVLLNDEHWRARISDYIDNHIDSVSRRERLRGTSTHLGKRLSAGVHDDISPDEAKALLLNTYMFVGEIITLPPLEESSDGEYAQPESMGAKESPA